ncbi:MAG: bifunctional folylpolyglutamate synthase/dihydrofolate synthase, partial [Nanoarchaeota archaeon]|nr:bifunctional folylpolyglutamate synthase/dihydrofolate synthase [Nanoarchaeota archaeon]
NLQSKAYNMDLAAVTRLLENIGNPQKGMKVIHVAGTNGKGSVCAMLSSILCAAGYKIGMYTSPHLKNINERFKICGEDISDDEFEKYFSRVIEHYDGQTYFEIITALAFLYFLEKKVDYLILEVGLGGRLDATNVVDPLVSVITNISLEHQEYLGNTIEKIAFEKAGIIKQGRPVVTACSGGALEVIKKVAAERGSHVVAVKDYKKINGTFDINGYHGLKLKLQGDFQLINAATAVTAAEILKTDEGSIRTGLLEASWPGRFEFIEEDVLIDCAHNADGAITLRKEIERIKKGKIVSVVGILNDKDKKKMVEEFSSFSDHIIFCKPDTPRAADPNELMSYCNVQHEVVISVKEALKKAKVLGFDLIIVCGSIYTVGEISS